MCTFNFSTLELVTKHGDDTRPRAILSQTWCSDDQEITYQDLQHVLQSHPHVAELFTHVVAQQPRFSKIENITRLAAAEHIAFIWADTCCIDKTSSAELSEAINSMFRWY